MVFVDNKNNSNKKKHRILPDLSFNVCMLGDLYSSIKTSKKPLHYGKFVQFFQCEVG